MNEIMEAVRGIAQEKGISLELVRQVIGEFMKAAYKKRFGTDENAEVEVDDFTGAVKIFSRRVVVEDNDLYDPVSEVEVRDVKALRENVKIGDSVLIEVDPAEFDRMAVYSAKQRAKQFLRDIQKDTLYSEYKDKVNEIIIGYHRREKNGTIYIDLGRTEGVLPKKNQSAREVYRVGDRIKTLVQEVKKTPLGLQVLLTRRDPEFVKRLFELEVPEISEGVVLIQKIVREAGYRTKIAVRSTKEDVDPVGACVGLKGSRIQNIMKELEGERIDILRYDTDPKAFIQNALSPAKVLQVIVLDHSKKSALAIVAEADLSLAIGKMGTNVKLANRLVDWNIDVRTEEQFAEMDIGQEYRAAAEELFQGADSEDELISKISELEGIPERVVDILAQNGIVLIENLVNLSKDSLEKINGLTAQDVQGILQVLEENVEISYEDSELMGMGSTEPGEEEEEYQCPECGHPVTIGMAQCPNCNVGLSFEFGDEVETKE